MSGDSTAVPSEQAQAPAPAQKTGTAIQQQPQPAAQQALAPQLYLMLLLPFTVFALVLLVRALPWRHEWLDRKPLGCDACAALWGALVVALGLGWAVGAHWSWVVIHLLPAPGIAMLLLAAHKWLTRPTELPLPPMEHLDETRPYPAVRGKRR